MLKKGAMLSACLVGVWVLVQLMTQFASAMKPLVLATMFDWSEQAGSCTVLSAASAAVAEGGEGRTVAHRTRMELGYSSCYLFIFLLLVIVIICCCFVNVIFVLSPKCI
ncbi:unnamed protein product [Polarella glacialis]|uniref:Uncharacterized protein n=1 Tax=Polarella glacialis TaxID=89957 RepID=A0A813L4B5_POLGL|nr:unnamed protein product [Polarella glacialis]